MNFKTTLIMAFVFAVGIASVLFINKSDEKKQEIKELEGKLLHIEPDSIDQIILQLSNIHMVKKEGQWQITEPVNTLGDESAIHSLANMFDFAKIERTISSDPAAYAQYGLSPDQGRMIIIHNNIADTLYLGDKSPTGSFVFARRSAGPEVFLTTTSLQTNIAKSLYDLRDKKVVSFEKTNLQELIIKNRQTIKLVKSGMDWQLTEPVTWPADEAKVNELVNRLNSENAKEFVDEEPSSLRPYGLNRPGLTLELYLGANKAKKTLFIGDRKNAQYYAYDETRQPVMLVDSAFVHKFQVNVDDLRDKKIANYTITDVDRMELTWEDQHLVCVKDTSGTWTVPTSNNAEAKTWKVSAMIRAVTSLEIEQFINDNPSSLRPYGLQSPPIVCKLYNKDILLTELLVGQTKGNDRYFKIAAKSAVFACDKSKFAPLKPNMEELLEEAPEVSTADQP